MNKKGFTLIELMIVVAIIGILTSIAIPKFQRLLACGGDKRYSSACTEFKRKHPDMADVDVGIRVSGGINTSGVQVVNDTTIVYLGHVYRRID